jgi:hypothetical protein
LLKRVFKGRLIINKQKMKKYLLWLPAVLLIGAIIYRPVKEAITEKPVDKNISFAVYKSTPYTSDIYGNTSARLNIVIDKVKGGRRTQVWSKSFDAKLLKQYPSLEKAISQTVTVPNVLDGEHLEISYTITYDSDGSQLQMHSGTVMTKNEMISQLDISI